MKIHLIAIDLDGTLLDKHHQVSLRATEIFLALEKRGHIIVLSTGRMHQSASRFASQLHLQSPIISYNGSLVRPNNEVDWLNLCLHTTNSAEIVDYCSDHDLHLNYYLQDRLYIAKRTQWADFYQRQTGSEINVIGTLKKFDGSSPTKLILIDTPALTDQLLSEFQAKFGDQVYVTKTNPEYLEFMNPAANKGAALALVAEKLGISRADTIAIGDAHNDLPMIRWAGIGIAMGNADSEVQSAAKRVIGKNDEDGLAKYLEELI